MLCTDGPCQIDDEQHGRLERNGIGCARTAWHVSMARMASSSTWSSNPASRLPRRALFFSTGQVQQSDLSLRLGCEINEKGTVRTGQVRGDSPPRPLRRG